MDMVYNLQKGDIILQHDDDKERYIIQSVNRVLISVFRATTEALKIFPVTHLITDNWFVESNNRNMA